MPKKKFDVKKLSFPVLPGAAVYFVIDDEKVEAGNARIQLYGYDNENEFFAAAILFD